MRPAITSHGAGSGFVSAFIWDGNRDYSPILARACSLSFPSLCPPPRAAAPTDCPFCIITSLLERLLVPIPIVAVSTVLKFWEALGWERGRGRMRETLREGVDALTSRWGTETLARWPADGLA